MMPFREYSEEFEIILGRLFTRTLPLSLRSRCRLTDLWEILTSAHTTESRKLDRL